jgi:rubrerythrin
MTDVMPGHWTDNSRDARRARNRLREDFRRGHAVPQAPEHYTAAIADKFPQEFFRCSACGTGPHHITWGGICPSCSGAD